MASPSMTVSFSSLLDVLWTYYTCKFLDKIRELEMLDQYFCAKMVDALMSTEAPFRDFFFRYLTEAFAIPIGIYHFIVAGDYFAHQHHFQHYQREKISNK